MKRWFQERKSDFPWEQDGLDYLERKTPKVEPYRAWATFSFVAPSGRVHECDLFVATPGGLYLVELKGHPGRVANRSSTWLFHGSDRVRTLHNPLELTNFKARELRQRLSWAVRKLENERKLERGAVKVPWIEPAIFLTDPGLVSELDEVQRTRVFARDGIGSGLPGIWDDLLRKPPEKESRRVTAAFSRHLPDLLEAIGITGSKAHLNFGDGWRLRPEVLDAGPTWEDRLADRRDIVREQGRVRIYLASRAEGDDARSSVDRAARREYQVLQGINHRGIAQAVQIGEHQGGPAILFRHDHRDLRLDSYLDVHGASLRPEVRLDLVRQLAEAVRYAHNRSLYHRALAARSVYVSARDDGSRPVPRIIDWQTAARDFDTFRPPSIGNSTLDDAHVEDAALVYLAPEFDMPYADPVDLDVFGLGAIAYLILTGQPPGPDRQTLVSRITEAGGLHPYAVADGLSDQLDRLVFNATRGDHGNRLESADRFLEELERVEEDTAVAEDVPAESWAGTDPLTALPGQAVDGDADGVWRVERILGNGATSKALLVGRVTEDEDGGERSDSKVLKIALDESRAPRLGAEAEALQKVGGGAIVRLRGGPRMLADRTVLDLDLAGDRTLAAKLRNDGKLTYHELERFGRDLFRALDQMAAKGVRHRDLKPENFGVLRRADRTWELKLLDFSLTDVSDRDPTAGTHGYLDPFLGTLNRPDFDDHAERYAAAVTLHEMASGERPKWGDDKTDPRTTDDELPYLSADLFEPALRDGLTEFFKRSLHRDIARRFDTFAQMEDAWLGIFRKADATAPAAAEDAASGLTPEELQAARDAAAEAATLDTGLDEAGLSPRAASVAAGFNATNVGGLLDVPLYQIAKARGAGAVARKELNRRHKQWTAKFSSPHRVGDKAVAGASAAGASAGTGTAWDESTRIGSRLRVDELAELLVPSLARKNSRKTDALRLVLRLPGPDGALPERISVWPPQHQVAERLGVTQTTVSRHHNAALTEWARADWLMPVREELASLVREMGGVATAAELAAAVRVRHGAADQPAEVVAAKAMAVVRAAVEAEMYTGPGQDDDHEPRLARLRRGKRMLITLESLPGTDDPAPSELVDHALALGGLADGLAEQDPLPGRNEVVRELRGIDPPEGMGPLPETRLVRLAAAVAEDALVSPGLQLYPRSLGLAKALRLSQAAAGVRHPQGITLEDLLNRVQARFPELDAYRRTPSPVHMEEALTEAGFPLEYNSEAGRFLPPAPPALISSSTTTSRYVSGASFPGQTREEAVAAKLTTAAQQGGFLALTLHLKRLPGTARAIAAAYPVVPVDFAQVFLTEFRALAEEHGTEWGQVLRADERLTRTGQVPAGLRSFVTRVLDRTEQRLLERAGPRSVLFMFNASLLARYFDVGGHDLLTRLQNAARRPADRPHGLWLLCPSEAPKATPNLDGKTIEAIGGEAEWTVLDTAFLSRLQGLTAA